MAALSRKDKQTILEMDSQVKEIRQQLSEQVKCLDTRLENKVLLVNDMQEFLRKRSECELDHAKNLERLADRYTDRFQKHRNIYGLSRKERAATVNLWYKLLKDTKYKAKSSAALGDVLTKNIAVRFNDLSEDIVRISRNVRETLCILQEEIMKGIHHMQQAMKNYYTKHSEFVFAKTKLQETNIAKQKVEESPNKKGNEKKIKNFDRIKQKREIRYNDSRIKATRARNEYLLLLESTTAALNKYYDHDIGDIVSKSDHNYQNSFTAALQAYCGSELRLANSFITAADSLARTIGVVDPDNDRLSFLEDNRHAFVPDKKFVFLKRSEDAIASITGTGAVKKELDLKYEEIHNALQTLKTELAEVGDVMVHRNNSLNEIYKQYDGELNALHSFDAVHPLMSVASSSHVGVSSQLKTSKEELENGLLLKFKEFILSQNLNTGQQAIYDALAKALGEISSDQLKRQSELIESSGSSNSLPGAGRVKPIKLFGTTLEHQSQQTGRDLPDIVESCIRFITKFGLEHQGIFRVSGTSQEISDMKKSFEEGKDPLAGLNHWKDINAVAGVFRAYFRELKDPLFPSEYCMDYIKISRMGSVEEQIQEIRRIFSLFPELNTNIIKYLLKFLNLVSTKCEINKMNPHNLAVVFGPTLIRAPANEDLITNQGQINIFMEFFINEFFNVFPDEMDLPPVGSYRDLPNDDDDDDTVEHTDDELGSDDEAEGEFFEAEALYDYSARCHKELSFKKGDIIMIFSRANDDWWEAQLNGLSGFVPVNYVNVASPEVDRLDVSNDDSSSGLTEVPSKAENSSEEPLLLEEKVLSPRKEHSSAPETKEAVVKVAAGSPNNVFMSIDPTAATKPPNSNKPVTVTQPQRSGVNLTTPQPFQPRSSSLNRIGRKQSVDSLLTTDSLSTTVTAVREAFSAPKSNKPPLKPLVISATDLKTTQSKLRPGTPDDVVPNKEEEFQEGSAISTQRGGSVRDMTKLFGRQGGSLYRKGPPSTTSDDGPSPTSDRRMSLGSNEDTNKPPHAPAVRPKPKKKDSSSGSQSGSSTLIASIRAAAAAKVVKETSEREETNL